MVAPGIVVFRPAPVIRIAKNRDDLHIPFQAGLCGAEIDMPPAHQIAGNGMPVDIRTRAAKMRLTIARHQIPYLRPAKTQLLKPGQPAVEIERIRKIENASLRERQTQRDLKTGRTRFWNPQTQQE